MPGEVDFNSAGSLLAAAYLSLGPIVILGVAYLLRKRTNLRGGFEISRRWHHAPLLALVLVYYGSLYWWLFYDQFYRLRPAGSGTWELVHLMPTRSEWIPVSDIRKIQAVTGDGRTHRMARIAISMDDGTRYLSSQVSLGNASRYVRLLQEMGQRSAPPN